MALVLVAGLWVAIYGYREFNRGQVHLAGANPDFRIRAADLFADFERDETAAGRRYNGKIVSVLGLVKTITGENGTSAVLLVADSINSLSAIRCSMDSSFPLPAISKGASIELTGICIGFNRDELLGSDLILNRCIIKKLNN